MTSERRYSDEEFALILRNASALQERRSEGGAVVTSEGLTLEEIRSIAADVGLDPEAVTTAAALLPDPATRRSSAFSPA